MGFYRYAPFPYRALSEVRYGMFQVFIAQEIEGDLFIADRCALVPLQTVFPFPRISKDRSLGVSRNLPHTPALVVSVGIPAGLALAIYYAKGFSHPSRKISVDGEGNPSDEIGCRPDQREEGAMGFDS
jgi:hypothetical protein